jgi:hypothetical protein
MTFPTEAERLRARGALELVLADYYLPSEMQSFYATFDALFPPQGDAPLLPPQNPTGQREDTATLRLRVTPPAPSGLEQALDALTVAARFAERGGSDFHSEASQQVAIARARVLSLAAPRLSREEAERLVDELRSAARENERAMDHGTNALDRHHSWMRLIDAHAALLAALTGEVSDA